MYKYFAGLMLRGCVFHNPHRFCRRSDAGPKTETDTWTGHDGQHHQALEFDMFRVQDGMIAEHWDAD